MIGVIFVYYAIKRIADLVFATLGLIVLSPFLIPVIIVLRFTGEGLVFFRQRRLGYNNKPFGVLKFVTMQKDSPSTGTITASNDTRILPFGKFLRNTKINELPQLINVLVGEMSIVGPRPLTEEAFGLYSDKLKPLIYKSRPGVTGIGSLVFRHEESVLAKSNKPRNQCYREDILPIKGALEVWYSKHKSPWVDMKIVVLTALALLSLDKKLYLKWFRDLPINKADLKFI